MMDPTIWVTKKVGWFLAKTGLRSGYRWGRRTYWHKIKGDKTPEEKNEELLKRVEETERRNAQKDQRLEQKDRQLTEKRRDLSVKERLLESIERDGISRQELIRKMRKNSDRPLPVMIIRYHGQSPSDWLKDKLDNEYAAKTLGTAKVIPPDKFPNDILDGKPVDVWMEDELFEEDKEANILYAAWADLRDTQWYWRWELETRWPATTLGEAINMDRYFDDESFFELDEVKDTIEHIRKGDIAFFASEYVSREELKRIHRNQTSIEKQLGSPDLKQIVNSVSTEEMVAALQDYVEDPENVAEGVQKTSALWYGHVFGVEHPAKEI